MVMQSMAFYSKLKQVCEWIYRENYLFFTFENYLMFPFFMENNNMCPNSYVREQNIKTFLCII
jgi:hypothetical protein